MPKADYAAPVASPVVASQAEFSQALFQEFSRQGARGHDEVIPVMKAWMEGSVRSSSDEDWSSSTHSSPRGSLGALD